MADEQSYIHYSRATIGEEEIAEVVDTLRSGWLTMGPRTRRFEEEFAEYVGANHAIAVNSCTSGLFLLYHALGIGPGNEVIVPTLTFSSTANTVVHTGATPVLVDVSRDGWSIDPEAVERAITPRTKAITVVHYAGASAKLAEIERIVAARAPEQKILIIEDCAHAAGTRYADGKLAGSKYPAAFSFYATKNMTTGEGGMITLRDAELAARLRTLRLHGISQDAWKRYTKDGTWRYDLGEHGFKMNTTDINSALGIHQLRNLDRFNARRREIANMYNRGLAGLPVVTPDWVATEESAVHLYPLVVNDAALQQPLITALNEGDIGTGVHFIPLNRMTAFQKNYGYHEVQFENAEWFFERQVCLPLYPSLTEGEIERVIATVRRFFV